MTVQEWLGKDNKIGIDIFEKKYLQEGETFDQFLNRVSGGSEDVKDMIVKKQFLFGGRILANRGLQKDKKVTYSNCYVLSPPEDNIESIFETASKLARTFSYGGGCGVDISKLRPFNASVNNAAKTTSGATSFMELYSYVTEIIGQNGRRGALMISMDCDHPDIEKFVEIKTDLDKVTKANISIKFSDYFMECVENNYNFLTKFTSDTGEVITKPINARDFFKKFCEINWDYAEPGALFWDTISERNLLNKYPDFHYAGVNPCAEESLPAGGSCLLGSINLSEFVENPFTKNARFSTFEFVNCVRKSVVALNDVLDEGIMLHPLQEQRDSVKNWRQIGLGIMGLADMFIKLGIVYGSDESLKLCEEIARLMLFNSIASSTEIAQEKGSFEKFDKECTLNSYSVNVFGGEASDEIKYLISKYGLRNSQILTIAPTGTISTMLGISGGIEPYYAFKYKRKTESLHGKEVYYDINANIVDDYINATGETNLPNYFISSKEIKPFRRIWVQSSFQKYIDASISSTINLPNGATVQDIYDIYMSAWNHGLKGVTIYRDGCKRTGILSEAKESKKEENLIDDNEISSSNKITPSPVNDSVIGLKRKLITGCGSLHVVGMFSQETGELRECFLSKGSTGGCNNFMIGLSRMISLSARCGVSIDDIIDQLNSTGACPSYAVRRYTKGDTSVGSCCPMAVGNALKEMYVEMQSYISPDKSIHNEIEGNKDNNEENFSAKCPDCGEPLIHEGGCDICKSCGWSHCS